MCAYVSIGIFKHPWIFGQTGLLWLKTWWNNIVMKEISIFSYIPLDVVLIGLTHWGRATHICVGNVTIIGSDNDLSPGRRQAII